MVTETDKKRVLILSYSFSSQTRNVLNAISEGLKEDNVDVTIENVETVYRLKFPIGSYKGTLKAMISTFFRSRIPIKNISDNCYKSWDLVILGGPTWSFQPSGPILSLLDRESNRFFKDQVILPVISCRYYWKHHFKSICRMLGSSPERIYQPLVFTHPIAEPWCTIGLFLKLAGRVPESGKTWFSKYYPKYGHTKSQLQSAHDFGNNCAMLLNSGKPIGEIKVQR